MLKNTVKPFFKDAIVYGITIIISRAGALLVFPVLARSYSVVEYGQLDFYFITISMLAVFFSLGQDSSLLRYFHENDSTIEQKKIISQTIFFQIIIYIFFSTLVWTFTYFNNISLFLRIEILKKILIIIPFFLIYNQIEILLRLTSQTGKYILLIVITTLVNILSISFAALFFKCDVNTILDVYILVNISCCLFSVWLIRDWISICYISIPPREMITYGLPLGIVALLNSFQPFLERVITTEYLGLEALGLYSAAAKISGIISLPIIAFNNAFLLISMRKYKDSNSSFTFNILMKIYVVTLSLMIILIAQYADYLMTLIAGSKYLAGHNAIFLMTFAIYLNALAGILGIGAIIASKTHYRLYSNIIIIALSLLFMIILSKFFGLLGIVFGVILAKTAAVVLDSFIGQRLFSIKWDYKFAIIFSIYTALAGFFITFYNDKNFVHFILILILGSILAWTFISREEKKELLSL